MIKKVVQSPAFLVVLFLVALALIVVGGIGTAQSAPRIQSADWRGQVELTDISTALVENGRVVASGKAEDKSPGEIEDLKKLDKEKSDQSKLEHKGLMSDWFFEANKLKSLDDFKVGESYDEVLKVENDGGYDEYVRVTVTKYWVDENGNKVTSLDPDMIDLHFVEGEWTVDPNAKTSERTVLYYQSVVKPGETTSEFTDTIRIDSAVLNDPAYSGKEFRIKAVVDAVQTHNADQARIGAWGTYLEGGAGK